MKIISALTCFVYLFLNMHVLSNMSEAFVMKDESTFISILHAFFISFYPINTLTIKHFRILSAVGSRLVFFVVFVSLYQFKNDL